jgi:hypothetical protein
MLPGGRKAEDATFMMDTTVNPLVIKNCFPVACQRQGGRVEVTQTPETKGQKTNKQKN